MDAGKVVNVDTDAEVMDTSELDSLVNEYVVALMILGVGCMDTNDEESGFSPIMTTVSGLSIVVF